MTPVPTTDSCSFCNKHKDQVEKLILGHDVGICNECVDLCSSLLKTSKTKTTSSKASSLDPAEIKEYLDQCVVGQDMAKIALSVAIVNHYKRIQNTEQRIQKSNILMIGPTGTGKTLMAQSVARYLKVPFVIADATTLTEAGYVGDDVETLIARLYQAANNDVEATQRGIVFLDEVDKISRKSESATVSRDVSGEGVQQALLKLVEGTRCKINVQNSRKGPDTVEIDTQNILFIAGGAFVGLDKVVQNRTQGTAMGFGAEISVKKDTVTEPTADDLVRYGLIPEFVGRFPVCVNLHKLTKDQLISILTKVKDNLVGQYQWLFKQDGVELEFETESLELIAERTIKTDTGARGLHSELERVLLPHMYNLGQYRRNQISSVIINKDQVNKPMKLEQGNQ